MKDPKPHLAILYGQDNEPSIIDRNPMLRFRLSIVRVMDDGRIRNLDSSGHEVEKNLDNLSIGATMEYSERNPDTRPWGFHTVYRNVYQVEAFSAKRMARVLSALNKRLDKMTAEYGMPESFGTYVMRVAKALGIKTFVYKQAGKGYNYDDNEYAVVAISAAQRYLADKQNAFVKQYASAA
jgi:hypothetical protein